MNPYTPQTSTAEHGTWAWAAHQLAMGRPVRYRRAPGNWFGFGDVISFCWAYFTHIQQADDIPFQVDGWELGTGQEPDTYYYQRTPEELFPRAVERAYEPLNQGKSQQVVVASLLRKVLR